MNPILQKIEDNKIDYEAIVLNSIVDIDKSYSAIKVIIGVRGRGEFLSPTIKSLQKAGAKHITIVEHSHKPQHLDARFTLGINYIWIECGKDEMYSRSLAFNVGAILVGDCDWLLTHDVDCMVQKDFLLNVMSNISSKNAEVVQTFNKRRVLYCDDKLSARLINGRAGINSLSERHPNIFTCEGKAPGGSIMISRDLFFAVGGYDPELFYGYAPEDRMFWGKMSMLTVVGSCDRPVTDIFHLHHEFMGGTNPLLKDMIRTADTFDKLLLRDRMKIINCKSKLLEQWR